MTEYPKGHVKEKPVIPSGIPNGYQPTKGNLDKSKPPRQGSGVPRSPPLSKTTFNTEGIEVIRRPVKKSGSGAHATLPKEWMDETVVVIRTGE